MKKIILSICLAAICSTNVWGSTSSDEELIIFLSIPEEPKTDLERHIQDLKKEADQYAPYYGVCPVPYYSQDTLEIVRPILRAMVDSCRKAYRPTDSKYQSAVHNLFEMQDLTEEEHEGTLLYSLHFMVFFWNELTKWDDMTKEEYMSLCNGENFCVYYYDENDDKTYCESLYPNQESYAPLIYFNQHFAYDEVCRLHMEIIRKIEGDKSPWYFEAADKYLEALCDMSPGEDAEDIKAHEYKKLACCNQALQTGVARCPDAQYFKMQFNKAQALMSINPKDAQINKILKQTYKQAAQSQLTEQAITALNLQTEEAMLCGRYKEAAKLQRQAIQLIKDLPDSVSTAMLLEDSKYSLRTVVFADDWDLFKQVEQLLPDWIFEDIIPGRNYTLKDLEYFFKTFGAGNPEYHEYNRYSYQTQLKHLYIDRLDQIFNAPSVPAVSPDLARNEINGGKVKRIAFTYANGETIVSNFSPSGKEKFGKEYRRVTRDKQGRVIHTLMGGGVEFIHDTIVYAGNIGRVAYHENILISDHYRYYGSVNHPDENVWRMGEDAYYQYIEYNYLDFDQYGNWTKREVIYHYIKENIPQDIYSSLVDQFFHAKYEWQRNLIEDDLIPLILDYSTKETSVETRKIEYYK